MNSFKEFLIRVSSFVRKETAEILRQPRLVATLILGPFLILFIFGIGYNNSIRKMRTVMVIPQDSKIEEEIREIAGRLQGAVDLVDFVDTRGEATQMLDNDQADLILVTPEVDLAKDTKVKLKGTGFKPGDAVMILFTDPDGVPLDIGWALKPEPKADANGEWATTWNAKRYMEKKLIKEGEYTIAVTDADYNELDSETVKFVGKFPKKKKK